MKRLFSSVLLVAGFLSFSDGFAKTASPLNNSVQTSVVREMQKRLPINTGVTGILTSIETPSSSLLVTTDMGDELLSLAKAAFNAGIPFSIHLTSSSFADGFTICFSVDELSVALNGTGN